MKISPIQNYKYKNINFKGSTPFNVNWRESYEPPKENKKNPQGMPEWFRKGVLFGLITLAIVNDPATKEYFKPEDVKQQEKFLNELFEDVSKMGKTLPAYHLNRLADVDKPVIKSNRNGNYNIELKLDNGKKIEFNVNTTEKNDSMLYGYFKSENGKLLKYKTFFNPKNPDEFAIHIRNKENKKYIFGRTPKGELYQIKNKKKVVLNRTHTKKYQEELERQKELDDLEFFTNKNDMWRKLNLILLFFLTINEWGHDLGRREEQKNKTKNNPS